MTSVLLAKFPSLLRSALVVSQAPQVSCQRLINVSSVDFAARKGTREKAKKKKVKVEIKKVGFIPHNQRGVKNIITTVQKPIDDTMKKVSTDDVFPMKYYKWIVYPAAEAINYFKESHHPTMYNLPNAFLNVQIELNMQMLKKTKFMDNFNRMSIIPHGFEREQKRTILVFCKEQENHHAIVDAGATLVGGVELVKKILNGDLNLAEYDYVIAHPNILLDIVPLRGLMKKKFPNPKTGSLEKDLIKGVKMHLDGIEYKASKHEYDPSFGRIDTAIGRLNMETKHLEENLEALLKDIDSVRPKRDGLFVSRCFLYSKPCTQMYKIDPFNYIESGVKEDSEKSVTLEDDDSDSDDDEKAKATA